MKVIKTNLQGVYILVPKVFGDKRGWFTESWSDRELVSRGLHYIFVQDNHSYSAAKGVLRGLHVQKGEYSQAKLVRCVRGTVLDVAVDLRQGSPTYKQWVSIELSAENHRQLLIPRGFAHGFMTLTDDTEFLYKADNYYEPRAERSIIWNDPDIGINWGNASPIMSEKDMNAYPLKDCDIDFKYEVKK